jgi:acetyl-CoA carboxylase biotin carboxylase subunit
MSRAFSSVLIANRGEIACRIIPTVQQQGLRAIAVYSGPDSGARFTQLADAAYLLAGDTLKATYLNIGQIIEVARQSEAEAIHPGYGFLSENADFAQACLDAGLVWIGPKPDVIRAMGDKITAKQLMHEAGVPVIPGWSGDIALLTVAELHQKADTIGYPLLVKAAAGGGGKGMRLVESSEELADALQSAQNEADKAFGDKRVFLEKYILSPRHVEFQILADEHGNVVHLGERECSLQRRHQKLMEESPSPALYEPLRQAMATAAVTAARAIGYTQAGTVEFVLGADRNFYFLEVNTRLQVEHPITELRFGLDLVAEQLRIASGKPLGFTQTDCVPVGHTIECRINAEDAEHGFMPSTGVIGVWEPPVGPGIRLDTGVGQGSEVTIHFDSMLAKLIVHAPDRPAALARMQWALAHFIVLGVLTNIPFLQKILAYPAIFSGNYTTHVLEAFLSDQNGREREPVNAGMLAVAAYMDQQKKTAPAQAESSQARAGNDPWQSRNAWSNGALCQN